MRKKTQMENQKGQFVLEYILTAVFVIGMYSFIRAQMGDNSIIGRIFSGPWASVAKMMEDGTWNVSRSEDDIHPLATNQSREGDSQ